MSTDPNRILKTIRDACMLLRASQGRRGMLLEIPPDARDVLIAGDLHGNLVNLKKILALANLDQEPNRHLVLQEFVHGTGRYPGGGCTSHRLLDVVCMLKNQYPQRVHLLLGNHELSQWTGRKVAKDNVYLNDLFEEGIEEAYGDQAGDFIEAYDHLFASMLLAVRTANRIFVSHSIPEGRFLESYDVSVFSKLGLHEADLAKGSAAYQLVWGRDTREETAQRFCKLVEADYLVTGHIPQEKGYCMPNSRQMIVDCVASPAACMLLPTGTPLNLEEFQQGLRILPS